MSVLHLLLIGIGFLALVGAPFLAVHLIAEWWFSRDLTRAPTPIREPETRKCMGCGERYHRDWDPPDFTPRKARADPSWMSGGLCPDCSGAD